MQRIVPDVIVRSVWQCDLRMLSDITGRDFGGVSVEPGTRQLRCVVALNHVHSCIVGRHLSGLGLLLQLEYGFPLEEFW